MYTIGEPVTPKYFDSDLMEEVRSINSYFLQGITQLVSDKVIYSLSIPKQPTPVILVINYLKKLLQILDKNKSMLPPQEALPKELKSFL